MLDKAFSEERSYWFEQFADTPERVGFPYDHNHVKRATANSGEAEPFAVITCEFSGKLSAWLLELSKGSDPRLYMELAAGLTALLHRYSGKNDIIIAAPIYKQEAEGEFINKVLFLRNRLSGHITFKELLVQVRETIVQATQNQNYPVERLLYELGLASSGSDVSLSDVALLLDNIHDEEYIRDLRVSLLFSFTRNKDKVTGRLKYNPSRFMESTIKRISIHYTRLLEEAFANLDAKLAGLEILTEAEKRQLLVDFNGPAVFYPTDKTIAQLFEEQACKEPTNIAVVCENEKITYSELNEKADVLAHILRSRGAAPEMIVGLMLSRSIGMLIGILGVLKAGSAYLPMNPIFPRDRLNYMIKDSGTKIVVTTNALGEKEEKKDIQIIYLDTLDFYNFYASPLPVPPSSKSSNLAYVIYTSGSTGNPKGVMMEHRPVNNLVWGLMERIYKHYDGYLNVSLAAPFEFDASIQQIFGALLQGHALHVATEESRIDGTKLIRHYREHKIDISDGTPTHIRIILESMGEKTADFKVKHFIIAGETLPPEIVQRFLERFEGNPPRISNLYGPTETCVDSTSYDIQPETVRDFESIPIGNPLPNEQVYILDRYFGLQPVGVPGELYISGDGLARGYVNNPELTFEKFCLRRPGALFEITAPGPRKGFFLNQSPIYKTGDLARWLPDGNIEFFGRIDQQLKIRGFRIEPAEIESCLLQHPDIEGAVVTVEVNRWGYPSLCAYLAAKGELNSSAIRSFLASTLPEYMLPEHFVKLERIPLTASGKINRRALSQLGAAMKISSEYLPPRTPTEKILVDIWKQELGVETVGIKDNFFDAGGDSLIILKVNHSINSRFSIQMSIEELYENQTIHTLSRRIDEMKDDNIPDAYKTAEGELEKFKKRIMERN